MKRAAPLLFITCHELRVPHVSRVTSYAATAASNNKQRTTDNPYFPRLSASSASAATASMNFKAPPVPFAPDLRYARLSASEIVGPLAITSKIFSPSSVLQR